MALFTTLRIARLRNVNILQLQGKSPGHWECIRKRIGSLSTYLSRLNHQDPCTRQMGTDSHSQSDNTPFSGEIPIDQVQFKYSKSGGPGGQHVNKVATKVEVRFNVRNANWIPDWIKPRLAEKEGNRITKNGELIITSDKTRKQLLNQADCLNRLRTMIFDASKLPKELSPEEIALAEKRKANRAISILKEKRRDSLKKVARGSQGYDAL